MGQLGQQERREGRKADPELGQQELGPEEELVRQVKRPGLESQDGCRQKEMV